MILLADSEGSDQPARLRRLIWAFVVRIQKHVLVWRGPFNQASTKIRFLERHNTSGTCNLVMGSRWLYTENPYANFRPCLTRHPNVNKRINFPDLLTFSNIHRHILKNRTMLFTTNFISASEKIGAGLKKQAANFLFPFHPEKGSQIFLL